MFTNNLLSIITWLPAVGAILILGLFKKEQNQIIKKFATAWLALDFIISLWLFGYDRGSGGFQFLEDHQWIPVIGARYQMGADGVAVLLLVLTTFLVMELHTKAREGVLHSPAAFADDGAWGFLVAGSLPFLFVL